MGLVRDAFSTPYSPQVGDGHPGCDLLIVLAVALIQTVWISPRDVAYRFSTPGVAGGACERQARDPALLAAFDNSEDKSRAKAGSDPGFECML